MKTIKIILSLEAEKTYNFLKSKSSKKEKILLNSFFQKTDFLKNNHHYGKPISKKLFPLEYKIQYSIKNLFHVELPLFWRLLYTVKNNEDEIIIFILDIINHKKYNKEFGYK